MSKIRLIQFLILFFVLSPLVVLADLTDFTLLWNRIYDSGRDDVIRDLDAKSNIHIAGYTYNGSNNDYLIMKYNNQGDLLWQKTWDSGFSGGYAATIGDKGYGIAVDESNDDVYVTGDSPESTHSRAVTLKYALGGDPPISWMYDVPNNDCQGDLGYHIVVKTNYVYVIGASCKDYISEYYGDWDFLIIKYDTAGNLIWSQTYDGGYTPPFNGGDFGYDIDVDESGNVYVVGESYNGSDYDFWLMKLSGETGNQIWQRRINYSYDVGYGIVLDNQNNVYVAGYVYNGVSDVNYAFVRKYDNNGNELWSRFLSNPYAGFQGIDIDNDNKIYLSGFNYNYGISNYDYLAIKIDKDGNIVWGKTYDSGSGRNDASFGIGVDSQKNVYLSGEQNVSFNPGTFNALTIKYAKPCGGPFSGINFTDSTISSGQTPVRKTHFDELRWDVNILRDNAEINSGGSWYSFTDTIWGYLGNYTAIRAVHLSELRQKLAEVYNSCGDSAPTYADSSITAGQTQVRKVHIDDLRSTIQNAK